MFADRELAERIFTQNKAYFSTLAPVARNLEIDTEPYLDLGDTFAFFAGDGSPLTQGGGAFADEQLDGIDEHYRGKTLSWEAVLTPFSGIDALGRILSRGGRPEGWEATLYLPLDSALPEWNQPPEIEITEARGDDLDLWANLGRRGFFGEEPSDVSLALTRLQRHSEFVRRYVAHWKGSPAGVAGMTSRFCQVALLGGMSTLPEFRGRGIQAALLRRRIEDARNDADVAVVGTSPGSTSQRNAERMGFRVAYTQLSLRVPVGRSEAQE